MTLNEPRISQEKIIAAMVEIAYVSLFTVHDKNVIFWYLVEISCGWVDSSESESSDHTW